MKQGFLKVLARSLFCLLLAVLLLGTARQAASQESIDQIILHKIAARQSIDESHLVVGDQRDVSLPLTGQSFTQAKVIDITTGEAYAMAVDIDGNEIDADAARKAEREAYDLKYGRLDPALYDLLQATGDSEEVRIGIWMIDPNPLPPAPREEMPVPSSGEPGEPVLVDAADLVLDNQSYKTGPLSEVLETPVDALADAAREQARQAQLTQEAGHMIALQAPLVDSLEAMGAPVVYASPYTPIVFTAAKKADILNLAQRSDIDMIYVDELAKPAMDIARITQKADWVNIWGFNGSGIKVAVVEGDRITTSNPYLAVAGTRRTDLAVGSHATAVAGMIASTHSSYKGIASGVSLYSGNSDNMYDSSLIAAEDWAYSTGVDIINNSWGGHSDNLSLNITDRHDDYLVRNNTVQVVTAAGNENDGCNSGNGRVLSPGRAFNSITVGNMDDKNSLTWSGDSMDACSSYVNPDTGMEKPEVSASGSNINSTTTASPWTGGTGSGTSYAAPQVVGEVALMMQTTAILKDWPEAAKAAVIASALHNVEGDARLSNYDGAGSVDIAAGFIIANHGTLIGEAKVSGDFPYTYTFYASQGEQVHAAIAWDSNPSGDYSTDPLQADIDMHIYDASNNLITYSISSVNSYEVVNFAAPVSGNYTMSIEKFSFAGTIEYIGAAWFTGNYRLADKTPVGFSTPPISRNYFRVEPGALWTGIGIRNAASKDNDIQLYSGSFAEDPANHVIKAASYYGGAVDFVLVDRNHAGSAPVYSEVYPYSTTGGAYTIEYSAHVEDLYSSAGYGPYTITAASVLRVWDIAYNQNIPRYVGVRPTSGNASLSVALFKSSTGDSNSWYQGRPSFVAQGFAPAAGKPAFLYYTSAESDWLGLVVANEAATTGTTFLIYVDSTAPTGSVAINSGATRTTSPTVTLNLSAADAETGIFEMSFSNDGTNWSGWESYATSKTWTLAAGDGTKTVYTRYMNGAGMVSVNATDTIILDTTLPTGSLSINNGAAYTNSTAVTLYISAFDAGGLNQMRFSNNNSNWSAWETIATPKAWTLTAGDGTKTVYVQYSDLAGNISNSISDTIILDTTAPGGTISINSGAAYTNSTAVTLSLTGTDAGIGGIQMRFSNDAANWSVWEPYNSSKAWTISGGDGNKTVYMQYRDALLNTSGSITDSITLDTAAPSGSISINSGAAYATSTAVMLTLNAADATSGMYQMRFSNDGSSWSGWETYGTSKSWTLPAGDGGKAVYVQYRDNALNASGSYSDTITLDTAAPTGSITINSGATYAASANVTLSLSASDVTSGVSQMRFSNDGSAWSAWEAYSGSKSWTLPTGDGPKTVYVQYRDTAGNASSSFSDTIILDANGPTGSITIAGGSAYTNTTAVTLTLSATDAGSSVVQMSFSNDNVTWSPWESYATSKAWALVGSNGTRTVYARFNDVVGNISTTYSDTIIYDNVAPGGTISINSGAGYTNSTTVTLTLSATDATSGMYQMRFSNDGSSWSAWEAYGTSKSWTLPAGDGSKTVYVQYRDNALNASGSSVDTITLDTVAPSGTVTINSGATYTASPAVTLSLSASDATSGVAQMRFSNDGANWSAWEPYTSSKSWTTTPSEGSKDVYAQIRDGAGNDFTTSDTIILDLTPPFGTALINSGAAYATTTGVTLTLSAADALSGVSQMRFSNDGSTWSVWEAYSTSKGWTLSTPDGLKTVYAQFRDGVNNTSASASDTIILDTVAPTGSITINGGSTATNLLAVTLTLSATDSGSGVALMRFSNDGANWSTWEAYNSAKNWTLTATEGSRTVYVQYQDYATRASGSISDTIMYDITAPSSSATSPVEGSKNGFTVSWSGSDALSGIETYDVEYRVGSGAWTLWLTATTAPSAVFGPTLPVPLEVGLNISFRVRAVDRAGNNENFPTVADTTTTVIELSFIYLPTITR